MRTEAGNESLTHYCGGSGDHVNTVVASSGSGTYLDQYISAGIYSDVNDPNPDGAGAYTFSAPEQLRQIGNYCFEIMFPLDSADPYDAHLIVGKPFGFTVDFTHWNPDDTSGLGYLHRP